MTKVAFNFPKNFLWGASISTHQVEGGNHNQWTVWELETAASKVSYAEQLYGQLPVWPEIKEQVLDPNNYVSGQAADHFNRFREDFQLAKDLNLNTLRCGIEWSRIEPEEGKYDQKAVEHYRQYFLELKKLGIRPMITLWHWTMPVWFADKGGFAKTKNVQHFVRYTQFITDQLGEFFSYVITLNEPTGYAGWSYKERRWPPQEGSTFKLHRVLINFAHAHRKAYKILKSYNPKIQVGLAHNCAYYYKGDEQWLTRLSVWFLHKWANEYFINLVRKTQDFLGLNYYFSNRIIGRHIRNPNTKLNDLGWDMQPALLEPLTIKLHNKYRLPIIISESGVADMHDRYRKWWIEESLHALQGARVSGVKVQGYIHWSLLDNFEWAEGFWPRFGLVAIDYKTQKRTVRASAKWYATVVGE